MIDRISPERPGWSTSEPPNMSEVHGDHLSSDLFPEIVQVAKIPDNPYLSEVEIIDQTRSTYTDLINEAKTTGADLAIKKSKKNWLLLAGIGIGTFALAIGAKLIYDHQKAQKEVELK